MLMMNKTLAIQLSRIVEIDPVRLQQRKAAWASAYMARQKHLQSVEDTLNEYGYVKGTKHRSQAYSQAVSEYDMKFYRG